MPPVTIAGARLVQRGDQLQLADPTAVTANPRLSSTPLTLGVVADTRRATPATLAQLSQIDSAFERAGVDAVVVLGGIDPTFEGARQLLRRLGASRPLLALPGDSSSRAGFQAAMRELGPNAVDLTLVHVVHLPQATLAAVPGYFLPHHLAAGAQGCSYSADDLRKLSQSVGEGTRPRVLLAHGPPRGRGLAAVDRSFGGLNIGDPQLNELMQRGGFSGGLFAHVSESAGHATKLDQQPLAAHVWSDTLLLNAGSANAGGHEDLDGRWRGPSAAVVQIRPNQLRYELIGGGLMD